jgi:hypothetical protein
MLSVTACDAMLRYNNELLDIPVLLTNLPHFMRFDVISRMCRALGCFNVQTHPLFVGLNSGAVGCDV